MKCCEYSSNGRVLQLKTSAMLCYAVYPICCDMGILLHLAMWSMFYLLCGFLLWYTTFDTFKMSILHCIVRVYYIRCSSLFYDDDGMSLVKLWYITLSYFSSYFPIYVVCYVFEKAYMRHYATNVNLLLFSDAKHWLLWECMESFYKNACAE